MYESVLMWPSVLHHRRVPHAKLQTFIMHVRLAFCVSTFMKIGVFSSGFASPFAHLLDFLYDVFDSV